MHYFGLDAELRDKLYREAKHAAIAEFLFNKYPVYTSKLFDRKVDFISKVGDEYIEIQIVKIKNKSNFVYTPKNSLVEPKHNRYIYLFLFSNTTDLPKFFFIPSGLMLKPNNGLFKDIGSQWQMDFSPEIIDRLKEVYSLEQFWGMCRMKQMTHDSVEHNKSYYYQEREPNENDYFQDSDDDIWKR